MGRIGPLDHPDLREVERLIDSQDLAAAQQLLASLGGQEELSDGVAYLSTRLLFTRGRLPVPDVVDRLREILVRAPGFVEARAMLNLAEQGHLSLPPVSPSVLPRRSAGLWGGSSKPPTVPASPQAPRPSAPPHVEAGRPQAARIVEKEDLVDARAGDDERHTEQDQPRRRVFQPLSGLDSFGAPQLYGRSPEVAGTSAGGYPDIPKAPALPQFRDNHAPPSYAPGRLDTAPEPAVRKGREQLPRDAGRYSEAPTNAEVFRSRAPQRGSAPPGRRPTSRPPMRAEPETVPHRPDRLRDGPDEGGRAPSVFELATWIDEGRYREAIAAINRLGTGRNPGLAVLHARALAGAGYVDQALEEIARLEAAPLLDPELRASCARLLVELGDPERALGLASSAMDADPDRPLIRLTFALAVVRSARRRRHEDLMARAERALAPVTGREGPLPALSQALRACIQAATGDPEKAISHAQRAIGLDPRSPDALAALAEAAARLSRREDCKQAFARLDELAPDEADAIAPTLARHGVAVRNPPSGAPVADVPLWTPIEEELAFGHRADAIRDVERAAEDAVHRMSRAAAQSGMPALAAVAAGFLTTTPVLSCFSPYDHSLFSLSRLERALDVLYGAGRRPAMPSDDAPLVRLVGAYLGETLRSAQDGHWGGRASDLDSAFVVCGGRQLHPFRIVAARLREGEAAGIGTAIASALPPRGTAAWQRRMTVALSPRMPWAPHAWPRPSQLATIGRSLPRSPIGKFCEHFAEGPLDRTTASFIALDTFLELVAPKDAPRDPDADWTRRVAVLVGAYVGETLRELVGGHWVYGADTAEDALAFRVELKGGVEALPVAHVLERATGERSSSLVDYARTLMRRVSRG